MDLRSLSLGERIAAASGAVLFVFLFVSWLEGLSAWELFDIVDVLLALLALVAVAIPLARAAGAELPIRPSNKAILTRIGVVALTVTVAFFLEGSDRGFGIFLSVLAAAGILYGAITMPGDEAPARRRDRTRRPLAEEDFEEPPPGMESWREGGLYGDEPERQPGSGEPGGRDADELAPPRGAGEPEARPPGAEERARREGSAAPEPPERTEVREPRRPPEVPPTQDR